MPDFRWVGLVRLKAIARPDSVRAACLRLAENLPLSSFASSPAGVAALQVRFEDGEASLPILSSNHNPSEGTHIPLQVSAQEGSRAREEGSSHSRLSDGAGQTTKGYGADALRNAETWGQCPRVLL